MSQERLEVGQLIPTSATAPSNAGIYSPSQGVLGFTASSITVTDPITNVRTNVVTGANHAAEHAAMGIFDDGDPGALVMRSERNISNATKTTILLPSAPLQLAILWYESGTSGNLKFVLEAASSLDADARLANDSAHGEIASGNSALVRFVPSTDPMYLYLLASSAVGGGSNVATIIAKVTE